MTGQRSGRSSTYRERNSTADRALDILSLFDDRRLVLGGQEVADALGVARSTAYRYLQSLVSSGFVEEQKPAGYRLGPRVFELARLARKGLGLSEVSLPVMEELKESVGETVLLTRRTGSAVVCLERVESDHSVRISYERGHVLPVNAGASALALLAWAPPEEIGRLVGDDDLPQFTETTVTETGPLLERLEAIRKDGYAISRGELDADVVGIAAPVRDADGDVVAAVSIAALSRRLPPAKERSVIVAVVAAAETIGDQLRMLAS
ncbi:IclR family transcriptional regulator [Actinomadura rupiterrae]|uniref:IclR family transcriptional regulator n=1 Tax=Actinomadura rupiterrae TaxID=559627 RepID=UPI0020A434F8|nr:IclR family transcriptional regulator [Actinomadura rupiterrae]MCP2338953.1 DNA-binding IclR family transcriptional regulator [Actinomadura rupiterrae]